MIAAHTGQSRAPRFLPSLVTCLALCVASERAWAEPSATAGEKNSSSPNSEGYDALLDRAVAAFDAEDYIKARTSFEQAYALRPNARVLRGMGLAALQLKRFTVAKRELTAALTEARQPLTAPQKKSVNEVLSWMRTHLASLQLHLRPPSARVELDGEPVLDSELWIEPGAHRLRISANGYETIEQALHVSAGENFVRQIVLAKGEVGPTALALAPHAAAPPPEAALSSQPAAPRDSSTPVLESWWFWTAVGVVVAGGVATTIALTTQEPSPSYEQGGLGGVMMPLGRSP